MANMSYCRFENTSKDLADCAQHMGDELENDYEINARRHLLDLCKEILEDVGCIVDTSKSEETFDV